MLTADMSAMPVNTAPPASASHSHGASITRRRCVDILLRALVLFDQIFRRLEQQPAVVAPGGDVLHPLVLEMRGRLLPPRELGGRNRVERVAVIYRLLARRRCGSIPLPAECARQRRAG